MVLEGDGREEGPVDSPGVLSLYGQAMMRVGQLEYELAQARARLNESQDNGPGRVGAPASDEMAQELAKRDATIATLKLQLSTVNTQLSRTEEKLKMALDGSYVRRRHRRRWWKFWGGR